MVVYDSTAEDGLAGRVPKTAGDSTSRWYGKRGPLRAQKC